jgi:hypothetical protein
LVSGKKNTILLDLCLYTAWNNMAEWKFSSTHC